MGSEQISEMSERIESGTIAVKSAISKLSNLMMMNTNSENIGKGMQNLVQKSSRTEKDRETAQGSLRTAFKFNKS